MTSQTPSKAQVRAWLQGVRSEIEALQRKLEPLLADEQRLRTRETLLANLLASLGDTAAETDSSQTWKPTPEARGTNGSGPVREYVVARALEILRNEGPLHINDLHARFMERGFEIPGAGEPVNLTVHLRRSDEIWSPSRGMYAVREGSARPPKPVRKKRTTKRRARRRTGKA